MHIFPHQYTPCFQLLMKPQGLQGFYESKHLKNSQMDDSLEFIWLKTVLLVQNYVFFLSCTVHATFWDLEVTDEFNFYPPVCFPAPLLRSIFLLYHLHTVTEDTWVESHLFKSSQTAEITRSQIGCPALGSWLQVAPLSKGFGPDDIQRSLPAPANLWFYDSHETIASRLCKTVIRSFSKIRFPEFFILSVN